MMPSAWRSRYGRVVVGWGLVGCLVAGAMAGEAGEAGGDAVDERITLEADLPVGAGRFTLVVDDARGGRVRNLIGGADPESYATGMPRDDDGTRRVRVPWDGLDDLGRMVPPGTYTVRGLVLEGELRGRYERAFYNPGMPPWPTADGRGNWGADISAPRGVRRSGERMVLFCGFGVGGSGTFAVGADGRKIWGEATGSIAFAANGRHVFTVSGDGSASPVLRLLRLDAATGRPVPFVREGRTRPHPLPLSELFNDVSKNEARTESETVKGTKTSPPAFAMAATDDDLVVWRIDGPLLRIDPSDGRVVGRYVLRLRHPEERGASAVRGSRLRGTRLYFWDGPVLRTFDLDTSGEDVFAFADGDAPAVPVALAFDFEGRLWVADAGPDSQIKIYATDGRMVGRIGRTGGRPASGWFDPHGMRAMVDLDVDAEGRVWVVESSKTPRRVSVWTPDGAWMRDYLGNAGHAGSGTFLHDHDPRLAYAEDHEIVLDPPSENGHALQSIWTHEGSPERPTLRPDGGGRERGQVFFSAASGRRREYFVAPPNHGFALRVFMRDDAGCWTPACAVAQVGMFSQRGRNYAAAQRTPPEGLFAGRDPADIVLWTDRDGDGFLQANECAFVPAATPTAYEVKDDDPRRRKTFRAGVPAMALFGGGWTRTVDTTDFSFYASPRDPSKTRGIWRITPTTYTDAGAPVFTAESWREMPLLSAWSLRESCPISGTDTVVAIGHGPDRPEDARHFAWYFGFDRRTGALLWRVPSYHHGIQGAAFAPMPAPGLLIGGLRIAGAVRDAGDAAAVFMTRGHRGEDYWITSDGLFVSSFFRDDRIPGPALPSTEEALRGGGVETLTAAGANFSGWVGRQDDGVVRMTGGVAPQAGTVTRVEGLDGIRYLPARRIEVTARQLVAADRVNATRTPPRTRPVEHAIPRASATARRAVDWDKVKPSLALGASGAGERGEARLAWDDEALHVRFTVRDDSPWRNASRDAALLFKGGDAVEVSIRPAPDGPPEATAGDVRFVAAPFHGETVVLAMREKAPDASPDEGYVYSSPVAAFAFDRVGVDASVRGSSSVRAGAYTVTLAIPWRAVGVRPGAGVVFRGDVGVIFSDAAGARNASRVYWSNRHTRLVYDTPHEAKLRPEHWGTFTLAE